MELPITESICVTDIRPDDALAYVEHFKDKQIYDQTLNIPYPYALSDATAWIDLVSAQTRKLGQSVNWALRLGPQGPLMGGIGFLDLEPGVSHRAEIGYWLARAHWNQGIMGRTVGEVTEFAHRRFGLIRISAHVFESNLASARVLEKNGFELEGLLRSHYKKDGRILNGKLYAKVWPQAEPHSD